MQCYTKNFSSLSKDYIYQNYHKHSIYTNVIILDSVAYPEDYAKKAKELGHGIISSCEHGYQGRYIESFQMAEKYDLKFLFAVESYFVKNRFEKDKTNAHMILAAKNENGRKAINRILSEANETGFYYRARIDFDLLFSLPKEDVWITSACIGGINKYSDYEEIIKQIHNYFGDNFYLEVQAHNVQSQKDWNSEILRLSRKYNVEIIAGVDSHYINPEDAWMREYLQKSGHIFFEEEEGFYMDYPSGETLYKRFQEQGVLDNDDIQIAMNNTNVFLNVEYYDSPIFNHEVKMPFAPKYANLSKIEKDKALMRIVYENWQKEKQSIPKDKWKTYEQEIVKELKTIFEINHSDYFLLNYEIIKNAVDNKGGMITYSGRGSSPSFYVNHLLGFTAIDRISCPITLYPERFLSASRIKAGSLADIDFNCGNVSVFAESQREILGENHAYPMITFGLLKAKSAWKMYCRANSVDFDIANQISTELDKYEKDLKYYDPESGDSEPQVLDYIPDHLQELFLKSKKFLGLVDHGGVHACGYLLASFDIREEVGIMRLKSKGGKETMVTVADGKWVEKYLMLKNDLLSVTCVKLVYLLYERCQIKPMSLTELIRACKEHPEVWEIYEKGYTLGVNQLEKNSSKHKAMKYKPHNISELSALIAGIRPAFKSLIDKLINRENFSYDLPTFDKLLQTEELPQSFILYQEQIMKVLAFAGIPMDDCYTVIKSISKKRVAVIESYKTIFLNGFSKAIQEQEHKGKEESDQLAVQIWGIIQDASAYGFNSSHSLSVSFDSLLAAYFKALYPLEFYEVYLNVQMDRADKAKALLAKEEARKAFGITILPMRFGQDNRKFTAYPEKNALSNCLQSIKGFGTIVGDELYKISKNSYDNFLDLLVDMKNLKINKTQIKTLIKLNYFEKFGKNKKLLYILELFQNYMGKSQINKKIVNENPNQWDLEILKKYLIKECDSIYKVDFDKYIKEMSEKIEDKSLSLREQLEFERKLLEIPIYINKIIPSTWYYVLGFKVYNDKKNLPYLILYQLQTGNMIKCSINKGKLYDSNPFYDGSILNVLNFADIAKRKQTSDGKWQITNELKTVIKEYEVLDNYNRNVNSLEN